MKPKNISERNVQEHDLESDNPYKILGVHPDSSRGQIKVAFIKLSKIYHPDAGGTDEWFQAIQFAYGLLSDTERRNKFDRTGSTKKNQEVGLEQAMAMLFDKVLKTQGFDGDIVRNAEIHVKRERAKARQQQNSIIIEVATLKDEIDRIAYSGLRENMYKGMLKQAMNSSEERIEVLEKQIDEMEEVLQELKGYSDKSPKKQQQFFETGSAGI